MKKGTSISLERRLALSKISVDGSVKLTYIGILYIVASILQCGWIYMVIQNWEIALKWVSIPFIGWALAFIWIGMAWCILHLFVIGLGMIKLSRNPAAMITQTPSERKKMKMIVYLLVLGLLIDIIALPFLVNVEDKSLVVFMTALIGGRILQANMEGILQFHRM